jgi:biotin-dependent carboxylase-like uncharacterized protein
VTGRALEVLAPGPLTLVQDLGRPGRQAWGVAPSGAFDRGAHDRAQRLVGNDPGAAGLEVLLGPFAAVARGDVVVAVTGALCAVAVGGRPEAGETALYVRDGERLELGPCEAGVRSCVGVRGGVDVPGVLGSRSFDVGGGIGPAPVAAGDLLPVGPAVRGEPYYGFVRSAPQGSLLIELAPGPHDDALADEEWGALEATQWLVGERSDRMGVRLEGGEVRGAGELASFPVVPGSVQLTPSGELVVLGPDAGVTGGYPVLGVVSRAGLDALAQARPGTAVRVRRRTRRGPGRRPGPRGVASSGGALRGAPGQYQ